MNDSFEGLYSLADDISFGERTNIPAEENFKVRVTDEVQTRIYLCPVMIIISLF